jgi:hypothetical protein
LEEFYLGLASSSADLFAVTESGCNQSITDAEIVPRGYNIIRCDRADGRKQGGVFLVATPRIGLRSVQLPSDVTVSDKVFELVCAKVYKRDLFLFLCCVVYIPPNSKECDYLILFRIIEQLCVSYSKVVVVGDFNLHSCTTYVSDYFEFFQTYCGFSQRNKIENCNNRQLDLVLTSLGERVTVRAASEALVPIDAYHPPTPTVCTLSRNGTLLRLTIQSYTRHYRPLNGPRYII